MMRNRLKVAQRWHGISDRDALRHFVANDAEVRALWKTPEIKSALHERAAQEMVDRLRSKNRKERTYWEWWYRKRQGDECVDKIIALIRMHEARR
jgi:hypothetical protein